MECAFDCLLDYSIHKFAIIKINHNSSVSSSILKGERNQDQLRPEEILPTLLETGESDAIIAYKHEAIERGFPFISHPPQINLGDPAFASY